MADSEGRSHSRYAPVAAATALSFAAVAGALVCPVPTASHPTIGAAVRDLGCTTAQVAAGTYPEHVEIARDLVVAGAGPGATIVAGRWLVSGATSDVVLSGLRIDATAAGVGGCWAQALEVRDGAAVAAGPDVEVRNSAAGGPPCRLFADSFESAGTLVWSVSLP